MAELRKWGAIYLGLIIHHVNQYPWVITEDLPGGGGEMWKISTNLPHEYYTSIKIRDASKSIGYDFRGNDLLGDNDKQTSQSWTIRRESINSKEWKEKA